MPRLVHATPKYRKHRASGQAVVTIQGQDSYLGPWKSKASLVEYDRLIAEWLANGRRGPRSPEERLTVVELLARFIRHAKQHYRKDNQPSLGLRLYQVALPPLKRLYGHTAVSGFGPLCLKALRQSMISSGLARPTVNNRIGAIKRVFRWGVEEELVPPTVYQALQAVRGLQIGRTVAPEPEPVAPVPEAVVQATLPHLPEIVADMVRWQRLTGCRPGEAWYRPPL